MFLLLLVPFLFLSCDGGSSVELSPVTQELYDNVTSVMLIMAPIANEMSDTMDAVEITGMDQQFSGAGYSATVSITASETERSIYFTLTLDGFTDGTITIDGTSSTTKNGTISETEMRSTSTFRANYTITGADISSVSLSYTLTETFSLLDGGETESTSGIIIVDGVSYDYMDFQSFDNSSDN